MNEQAPEFGRIEKKRTWPLKLALVCVLGAGGYGAKTLWWDAEGSKAWSCDEVIVPKGSFDVDMIDNAELEGGCGWQFHPGYRPRFVRTVGWAHSPRHVLALAKPGDYAFRDFKTPDDCALGTEDCTVLIETYIAYDPSRRGGSYVDEQKKLPSGIYRIKKGAPPIPDTDGMQWTWSKQWYSIPPAVKVIRLELVRNEPRDGSGKGKAVHFDDFQVRFLKGSFNPRGERTD
ncbi:MAG: hypothetical protein COB53_10135 [Elusimicrobia bacterium]|nr:MAG: hypothetical protein COB53_10135 [Elusimicrobiota bacterium]